MGFGSHDGGRCSVHGYTIEMLTTVLSMVGRLYCYGSDSNDDDGDGNPSVFAVYKPSFDWVAVGYVKHSNNSIITVERYDLRPTQPNPRKVTKTKLVRNTNVVLSFLLILFFYFPT